MEKGLAHSGPQERTSIPGETEAARVAQWRYRCICGKRFTNTYGRSGTAYCPKVRCQLICTAVEPVALPYTQPETPSQSPGDRTS